MNTNQFKPAWWLKNSHLQTIWPTLCRREIKGLPLLRERIELPDGDFIDIDWVNKEKSQPIVLILHGFEGSILSPYAKGTLRCIADHGWRGAFMHFRGCSGEPNRLVRAYHSGETRDVAFIVNLLKRREQVPIAAVGYSLGGNILLKWLGETANDNPLQGAIGISVPYDLHNASKRIAMGFSRLYQWYLVKNARQRLLRKFAIEKNNGLINADLIAQIRSIKEYDTFYTVPVHGFTNVDEYYSVTSCRQYLKSIRVPTLLLHAKDDPFMTADSIPVPEELSNAVLLELSEGGGHVGFISGKFPWQAEYWLEKRIPAFLKNFLNLR